MITTALLSALLVAGPALVAAHGHTKEWTVEGQVHPGDNPSNKGMYGATAQRPSDNSDQGFTDYMIGKVACGGASAGSGLETWDVTAGSTVTAHWDTWPDSHKGPVTEYMAACPATGCDGVAADSLKWFKINEATFDGSKWPTASIVSSLKWDIKIPAALADGPYLLRHDILAMHTTGGPQVYPYCIQTNLIGGGGEVPADSETTTFPAAYTENTDFLTWNLYGGDQSAFVPPGPAVWSGAGGGSAPAPAPAPSPSPSPSSSDAAPSPSTSDAAPSSSTSDAAPSPSTSDAAPAPSSSDAAPVPSPTASDAAPAPEPTDVTPSPSPAPSPSPSASEAAPPVSSSAPAPPVGGPALGGPAPPVTQNGSRWEVNGGSYHDEATAIYASCMYQMNQCKNAANALPNAQVSAGLTACDAQVSTCTSAGSSRKRMVVNRYAKRSVGRAF